MSYYLVTIISKANGRFEDLKYFTYECASKRDARKAAKAYGKVIDCIFIKKED